MLRNMKRWSSVTLLVIAGLMLSACAQRQLPTHYTTPPYSQRQVLLSQLRHQDYLSVHFGRGYTVGETVTIQLNSDFFFNPHSINLKPNVAPVLQNIAQLLGTYETTLVEVKAYTDNYASKLVQKGLTDRQAQIIANALSHYGADARLLTAVGYGDTDPLVSNATASGRAQNRRIIIQFRYYPQHRGYN